MREFAATAAQRIATSVVLLLAIGWTWSVVFAQRSETAARSRHAVRSAARAKSVQDALRAPCTLKFVDTPLTEVVPLLRNQTGINILLDVHALEEQGISPDEPVRLHVENIPLALALKYMLAPLDLAYYVDGPILVITTRDKAAQHTEIRVYPVADLLASAQTLSLDELLKETGVLPGRLDHDGKEAVDYFDFGPILHSGAAGMSPGESAGTGQAGASRSGAAHGRQPAAAGATFGSPPSPTGSDVTLSALVDLITQTCSPETWEPYGGLGTIGAYGTSLVVSQTPAVHDQIEELLTQLRERLQVHASFMLHVRWYLASSDQEVQRLLSMTSIMVPLPYLDGLLGGPATPRLLWQPPWMRQMSGKTMPYGSNAELAAQYGFGLPAFPDQPRIGAADQLMAQAQTRPTLLAQVAVPCTLGQTVAVVGGNVSSIAAAAIPVVAEQVAEQQIMMREGLAGVRAEFELQPGSAPERVVLRMHFTLTKRLQPERSSRNGPDQYRATIASTSIHFQLPIGPEVVVAVLPCDQDPLTHVVVTAQLNRYERIQEPDESDSDADRPVRSSPPRHRSESGGSPSQQAR